MPDLSIASPAQVGFEPSRLRRACDLLKRWTDRGEIPAAALCVGRRGSVVEPQFLGSMDLEKDAPIGPDALFLVASLTKPVVAAAAMMLVEAGKIGLDDRVAEYLPEFAGEGKPDVRLRHLLTHTSGLPDQLPENLKLRAAHAGLRDFVAGACRHPLLFPPGTRVRYQSMGFALLAEIIERVDGAPIGEFLRARIFEPLGMHATWLGLPEAEMGRVAAVRTSVDEEQKQATDWGWNSPYWLAFGAPWGGMVTSPLDLARFSLMMLGGGSLGGERGRVLSPAAVRAMATNQLLGLPLIPEEDRRCRPWGLGWRLAWPGHSANFGDLLGPRAYGHWGATGTLFWIDPEADAFCIILTTQPQGEEGRYLARASNAVAAALA